MKKAIFTIFSLGGFMGLFLFPGTEIAAQEQPSLQVGEAAVCLEVVNRECVNANNLFPANVGKLYCLTRIEGANGSTEVAHVWYHNDVERARIVLPVHSSVWRTYSSKIIQQHEVGLWQVKVLDSEGKVLKVIEFQIAP